MRYRAFGREELQKREVMREAYSRIKDAKSIVLATHINPDGDTISSALAMYAVLKRMGKKVTLYNKSSDLPISFDFLPNFQRFVSVLPKSFDLLIALDSGSFDRLGIDSVECEIVNIDHHKSNTNYGDFNIVDAKSPSTSLVVYDFLVENDELISRDIASCIYAGLVSDSDFFVYRGIDSKVFETASVLVKKGANPKEIGENIKNRNSLAKLRLKELFLRSMELKKDASVAVGIVTKSDFERSGAIISDSDELVNILISLSTVKLAVFLRELDNGEYKFSLRSKGELDVSLIAQHYGGGGHKNASGFKGSKEILNKIVEGIDIDV